MILHSKRKVFKTKMPIISMFSIVSSLFFRGVTLNPFLNIKNLQHSLTVTTEAINTYFSLKTLFSPPNISFSQILKMDLKHAKIEN